MTWADVHPDYEALALLRADERFEFVRARRIRSGAAVLLKRPRITGSSGAAAALQREAEIAAGLGSAATLLPRWLPGAYPLWVMEDPGGELLAERLAAGARPSVESALAIALHLAAQLAELHGRGLVHRGVRPQAVYVGRDGLRAWLVDHADAAPPSARVPPPPWSAPARLAYLAPELSGRLEGGVDARSDLYALGVVLYELLAGAPPFVSDDALEQIHWHIAGVPQPPAGAPPVLAALVMKLLAKAPEERYQSADGLAQDLAVCAREWAARGAIAPFALGRRDIGERLVFSSRLYGREHEVERLLQAFEAACSGAPPRLWLVEGYAGVGKTSLIQQLYRPIVRHKGWFIGGKFDQVMRGVPFGALIQSFQGLVRQLLGDSEARLAQWRDVLTSALGANGGVLAEVIPEIEIIIGAQPKPAQLAGAEAQNRFQRVLRQFVGALAQPAHPLVLFLDDLQWADAATLGLLEPLLGDPDIRCLLLIGAARDGERDASPRLVRTLAALGEAGVGIERLALGPLGLPALTALVADTLHSSAEQAAPLAALVQRKTGGNPFFAMQFLKLLEREGALVFDDTREQWVYRIDEIARAPLADNVVELMTAAIRRLPARAQYALTLAACIGNRFDAAALAVVSEQPAAATAADLALAATEGLIVAEEGEGRWAFLHDRVQQSAYALIPAERRQMVHLTIGRLLHARAGADAYAVVQHLNIGRGLVHDAAERQALAELNLAAGRRVKNSTAYESALELFEAGAGLVDGDAAIAFELALEAAECRYLCGQIDAALAACGALLQRPLAPLERARVVQLRCVQYENLGRYVDALASAGEGLEPLGVAFPADEAAKEAALAGELKAIERLREGRAIESLVELPTMRDAATRRVLSLLTTIWSPAYIVGDALLCRLFSATMVRLSLQHGNVEESAYGYVTHAISAAVNRAYREADAYGRLALAVNRRFDDRRLRAKVYQQFHAHVNFWCQPVRTCMAYAHEAAASGLDSGDFLYAAYAAGTGPWSGVAAAQDLAAFERETQPAVAFIEQLKNPAFADSVRVIVQWARALQGRTRAPLSLSDEAFDEADWLRRWGEHPFFGAIHAALRLQLAVLLGSADEAAAAAARAAATVGNMPGTIWPVVHTFWHAMARPEAGVLQAALATIDELAAQCDENGRAQAWLVRAELARLQGDVGAAVAACEQAIEFAAAHPLRPLRALAHEKLARVLESARRPALARAQWREARDVYAAWGAAAKVQWLEQAHGLTPAPRPAAAPAVEAVATNDGVAGLDLFSIVKATQAIGSEVELPALLARLLRIVLENAGAERGALVLEEADGPRVYANEGGDGEPLDASVRVPAGIVHYVRRSGESVVLVDAPADEQHGADPYVLREQPLSLVCLPVRRQGRTLGVLVLEHRRVRGLFTPARLQTLGILATQAAISIENSRLVGALKAENTYLRRDLVANVSHDLRTPLVAMRGYLELLAAKEDLDAEQRRQYLAIAVRQAEHLSTLTDELFELAKLDFQGLIIEREPFHFGELAMDVVQKFQLDAGRAQVTLGVDAAPRLPFSVGNLSLIERLLENLIGNALSHTPAGGSVSVRARVEHDRLVAEVADTGRGIDAAELPHLFERFWRSADNRARPGAGLGLAISQRIAELHGAPIAVDSVRGRGSCFRFTLPLAGA
jgi:predicted ATPase/signal transduction histidine kinase